MLARARTNLRFAHVEQCAIATFGAHVTPALRVAMPTALRIAMNANMTTGTNAAPNTINRELRRMEKVLERNQEQARAVVAALFSKLTSRRSKERKVRGIGSKAKRWSVVC